MLQTAELQIAHVDVDGVDIQVTPKVHTGAWTETTVSALAAQVASRLPARRSLVLVDGAGGSGKSTLAKRIAAALDGGAVVGVDDISWWLHPIDWVPQMREGVVDPWLAGSNIDYRPPGWIEKGREGSVVAAGPAAGALVLEGVGAARQELSPLADFIVWVDTDPEIAVERMMVRDLGVNGDTRREVAEFTSMWNDIEAPHHLADRPWDRADVIVDGGWSGDDDEIRIASSTR
jgi:hypothetical protein